MTFRTVLDFAPDGLVFTLALSPGEYVLGLALAALFLASSAACGIALRRSFLPSWTGALAALASSILALSVFLALCEALGSVGLFRRWTLVIASLLAAGGAALLPAWTRKRRRVDPPPPSRVQISPVEVGFLAAAIVIALTPFLMRVGTVYKRGMLEWDTLWYHEPVAARFAQTGRLLDLHYVNNSPDSFLPFNAELVHAVGMLAVGRDHLSPLINLGWAGLTLIAAWCLGRPWKAGAPAVVAVALVLSTPVMIYASAGSAGNDLPALALLLAATALVVNAPTMPAAVAVAGLAGGLAIGTKLTLVAPILALSGTLAVVWVRNRTWNLIAWWSGPLLFAGAFWYVRNAVRAHNPFPWFEIGIGRLALPSSTTPPRDCGSTTVAHYLTDTEVLRDVFKPDLVSAFGPRWIFLIALSAAGALIALRRSGPERILGLVAVLSALAYILTPATAGGPEGNPTCFEYNTRFSTPALTLGLVLVAVALARWRRLSPAVVVGGLAVLMAANVPFRPLGLVAAVAAGSAVGVLAHFAGRIPARLVVAFGVFAAVSAAAAVWTIQARYFENRYAEGSLPEPIEQSALRLRDMKHLRIAVGGFNVHYALYDPDLTNWVEYPVLRGPHGILRPITTCREWHEALSEGRYDYVVTYNSYGQRPPAEAEWTRSFSGASRILSVGINDLFMLNSPGRRSGGGCPSD